jgi:subtilisin family serine protease
MMHPKTHLHPMRIAALVLGIGLVPIAATGAGNDQAPAAKGPSNNLYIVRMADYPVASYTGGVAGYAATKPGRGSKLNPNDPNVVRYSSYLDQQHGLALGRVGGRKVYDYRYAFNGFAAELTSAQADALKSVPGVLSVQKDRLRPVDTTSTPAFLGLSAPGGFWDQLGGVGSAGEGIVVGIVDTGIWPESLSFSDRLNGKLVYQQLSGWNGKCVPGEDFTGSDCNQKLIGAQWYNQGFGGDAAVKMTFPYEFASARGADGHGTHTASTAAGNNAVDALVDGQNMGKISGMAPRARVAAYKVCWGDGIDVRSGCFETDSVAAIDQAVSDGVDVINFSIGGADTDFLDAVEVAFLFAADAGVFVAASAGNSGPAASTLEHPSPWLTTVAAGTKNQIFHGTVTLGDGNVYTGLSVRGSAGPAPLVLSSNVGLAGADPTLVARCYSDDGTGHALLDPAKVAGKIVVCDRGGNARVDKSLAVLNAVGVGMVLANTSPAQSLNADFHSVPTVHVDSVSGTAIKTYAAKKKNPTATLVGGILDTVAAPDVAAFSSRGPSLASGDMLKPDIMAPGVDVLAATSPVLVDRDFDVLSGTSMSSPHIAGVGALMKQIHPDWSPAAIKSALMTTATQLRTDGSPIAGGPFAYGAGEVVPNSAISPGLVYDAGFNDWLAFLCGTGQLQASYCPSIAIDPSNLNHASIAIGALAGSQTVKRTAKSVGSQAETYHATYTGLAGFTVGLPADFTVSPGASVPYQVTFTTNGAPLNAYGTGVLILTGNKGHVVKSPVVLRPVALAAPAEVSSNGGAINYQVQFGYNGSFTAKPRGLVPSVVVGGTVNDDPGDNFTLNGPGTVKIQVTIPSGITYARFSLFAADSNAGSDLDLYVYQGTTLKALSGSPTADEEVDFVNPAAGTYDIWVHGFATAGGAPTPFKLNYWLLGGTSAGNVTVSAPGSATLGATGNIGLTFGGLSGQTKYLGSIVYGPSPADTTPPTIVRVNTP